MQVAEQHWKFICATKKKDKKLLKKIFLWDICVDDGCITNVKSSKKLKFFMINFVSYIGLGVGTSYCLWVAYRHFEVWQECDNSLNDNDLKRAALLWLTI